MTDTNDCTYIQFDRAGEDAFSEPFHPAFTYPIFGEDEKIVGYQGLRLDLRFRSHDLKPSLRIKHKRKIDPKTLPEEVREAMEIESKLTDYLPDDLIVNEDLKELAEGASDWKPPGEMVQSHSEKGSTWQIWQSPLNDPRTLSIISNMRICIPFYIEGGTCDFLNDPEWTLERWKVFLLYQVDSNVGQGQSPYCLAGFATSYRNLVLPRMTASTSASDSEWTPEAQDSIVLDVPARERISQFLILPPFQGKGLGTLLYNVATATFLSDDLVFEITVEDPNEAFDDMRDYCDLARLVVDSDFTSLSLLFAKKDSATLTDADLSSDSDLPELRLIVGSDKLNTIRLKHKLQPRQFSRLVEMHLLASIPARNRSVNRITRKHRASDSWDRAYYVWRLLVKARVWRRNKDSLMQLEEGERIGKLEDAVSSVQDEYERVWEEFQKRQSLAATRAKSQTKAARKRVLIDDEDEESEGSVGKRSRR